MFSIRHAEIKDYDFWLLAGHTIKKERFENKIRNKECYILSDNGQKIGWMEYTVLWDNLPFLNLILLEEPFRKKGYGKAALSHWESDMRSKGFSMTLVSTRADEVAQHFFREQGYRDCGCLLLDGSPLSQPTELFLRKNLY